MLHLLQYCQNDFTFSPSLYSVALCDNTGLVLLILRLAMLFCHSSYCTMCIIHPDLVSFTFYAISISPLCNLKNFSFTCLPIIHTSYDIFIHFFCMQLPFYMFSTSMSLEDRLRLKTNISLCMAIMLDHPWQSVYTQYYRTV